MRPPARPLLLLVAALLLSVGLGACGNKHGEVLEGETEGIYLDLGGLKYQVQISRQLNPAEPEDEGYLVGVPAEERELAADETWYGIFIRVQNVEDDTHQAAEEFEIRDTQENVFRPIELGPDNVFAYRPRRVGAKGLIPEFDSPAAENTIQGSLLLFKIPYENLQNRPLEFEVVHPDDPETTAAVALDV
jgi:hypothetical protein